MVLKKELEERVAMLEEQVAMHERNQAKMKKKASKMKVCEKLNKTTQARSSAIAE